MTDVKKVNELKEFTDEELRKVAAGYSDEHWKAMTPEERIAAYLESEANRAAGKYCAYDDPNA